MKLIKVVITGGTGRMGQILIRQVLSDKSLKLIGVTEKTGHSKIGSDIGDIIKSKKCNIKISDDIISLFSKTDAVIDFSLPKATIEHAKYAAQARMFML